MGQEAHSISSSTSLPSSGYISYSSHAAKLLLQSSFETASVIGTSTEPAITMYDVNGKGVSNYVTLTGSGSVIWIENGTLRTAHTGTKSVGLRSDKALAYGDRCDWMLTHLDGSAGYPNSWDGLNITGDFYLSVWLYFPADWSIPTVDPVEHYSPNWYELMNPLVLSDTDANNPKTDIHIHRQANGNYFLEFQYEQGNGVNKIHWTLFDPWDISTVLGKWTRWAYFIHRSTDYTQAYVMFWLNGQMIGYCTDANGSSQVGGSPDPGSRSYHFYTENKNVNNNPPGGLGSIWASDFAKTYLDGDGVNYHYIWADDLEVWDGIP